MGMPPSSCQLDYILVILHALVQKSYFPSNMKINIQNVKIVPISMVIAVYLITNIIATINAKVE